LSKKIILRRKILAFCYLFTFWVKYWKNKAENTINICTYFDVKEEHHFHFTLFFKCSRKIISEKNKVTFFYFSKFGTMKIKETVLTPLRGIERYWIFWADYILQTITVTHVCVCDKKRERDRASENGCLERERE